MKKYCIFLSLIFLLCGCDGNSSRNTNVATITEYTDMILSCFSTNEFSNEKVSEENVKTILKAGIKAPSAYNSQICRFTVVNNIEVKKEILPELPEECAIIVISAPMVNQVPGVSGELMCGIAVESMYIAAQALGLGAHIYTNPIAMINHSLKDKVTMPADYEAVTLIVVGYPKNFANAVSGASTRLDFDELVNYVD